MVRMTLIQPPPPSPPPPPPAAAAATIAVIIIIIIIIMIIIIWQCGNTRRQNVVQKEAEKKLNAKFVYRDATNMEPEMYDCTGNNWSHWNSNEKLKKNLETVSGKHSIESPQKTAILGTSHTIRKVL